MAMARDRPNNAPKEVKTDGLRSYREAAPLTFPMAMAKHVVSKGIRAEINNNPSERTQGTVRDKSLLDLKHRDTGQNYLDGLVVYYSYFWPHGGLDGKRPAVAAEAELPFDTWADVATVTEQRPATPQN